METVREMTFEEEAVLYEKEARAEFAKENSSCDSDGVSNILRRGMRIIRKARELINGKEPKTNGDRIRAMSDEELAYWFEWRSLCGHIQIEHEELCATRGACGGCVLNWLKQPAEVAG